MKKYYTYIVMAAMIVIVFFIQCNVFPEINWIITNPNLMIILIAGYGLLGGHKQGLVAGILCGLLTDLIFSGKIGYYTLPYMYIGYLNGFFQRFLFHDNYFIPMLLCGASDLLMGCYVFVFSFALRGRLDFGYYLYNIMIPEAVYTVIISLVLFRVQAWIALKIEEYERKRGRKFV